MKKRVPILMAAILTACGAAVTSGDNSADAAGGKKGAGRERDQQAELDAFIKEAKEMESAVQNGGIPGCYGGEPCKDESGSTGSGGDDWGGQYKGRGGEFTNGDLNIARAGGGNRYSLALEIGAPGCGGEMKGTGTASAARLTMTVPVPNGGGQCRVVLDRQGSGLRVSESDGCAQFHGAQCSFNGTFARTRAASAAPETGKAGALPAQSASWIVGEWVNRGDGCATDNKFIFNPNGSYSAGGVEYGRWQLAGSVLSLTATETIEMGEEGTQRISNPRPVQRQILSHDGNAITLRGDKGSEWPLTRCR